MFLDGGFAKILETLSKYHSGLTLNEICAKTGLSRGTVLKHLKLLVNMNLVKVERQGNRTIYKSCIQDPKSVSEGFFFTDLSRIFLRDYIRSLDVSSCGDLLKFCFSITKLEMELTNAYCLLYPNNTEYCLPESLKIVANHALGFLSEVSIGIKGNRGTFLRFYRKRLCDILTRHRRYYVYLEIITDDRAKVRSMKAAYSDFRRPKNLYSYSRKELKILCGLLLKREMTWTQLRNFAELSNSGLKNILDKLLGKAIRKEVRIEDSVAKLYVIDFHGLIGDLLERYEGKIRKMLGYGKIHPEEILKQPLYPLLLSLISLHLRILHKPKTMDDSIILFMETTKRIHEIFLEKLLKSNRKMHLVRLKQYIKSIYGDLIIS